MTPSLRNASQHGSYNISPFINSTEADQPGFIVCGIRIAPRASNAHYERIQKKCQSALQQILRSFISLVIIRKAPDKSAPAIRRIALFFAQNFVPILDKARCSFGAKSRGIASRLRSAGGETMPGLASIPGRMCCVAAALGGRRRRAGARRWNGYQPSALIFFVSSCNTAAALSLSIWQVPAFSWPPPP